MNHMGISSHVNDQIHQFITIMSKADESSAESLNVASACAIMLGEIFRPQSLFKVKLMAKPLLNILEI